MSVGAAANGVALQNQQLWTQRRNRKIGGFRLLSKHDPGYRNIRDDDPMSGGDLSLNELADHWQQKNKQPSIQPISLHEHQWRVSAIIPEKETDEDEDSPNGNQGMETENNGLQGEKANSGSEKLASEQEGLMSPTELRSSKPNDPRCNSPANSTFEQGNGDKKRPFSSIADGDSAQQPAVDRKSVCVYCWEWRKKCDSEAQCKNCQATGVRCVRKLCEEGDRCKGRRCPCLHPGEWDQQDPEWIVEGGFLPKQRDLSEC